MRTPLEQVEGALDRNALDRNAEKEKGGSHERPSVQAGLGKACAPDLQRQRFLW